MREALSVEQGERAIRRTLAAMMVLAHVTVLDALDVSGLSSWLDDASLQGVEQLRRVASEARLAVIYTRSERDDLDVPLGCVFWLKALPRYGVAHPVVAMVARDRTLSGQAVYAGSSIEAGALAVVTAYMGKTARWN